MNLFKTSNAELGLYLFFIVDAFVPAIVAFFVAGQMTRQVVNKSIERLEHLSVLFGNRPSPIPITSIKH